jgi:hypothetical protein
MDNEVFTRFNISGPVDTTFLPTSFRPFISQGLAHQLISNLLSDSHALERCVEQSYRHYNNFDKIVLGENGSSQTKLVLHKWLSPSNQPEIHNHRWNFVSYVVQGELESHAFAVDPKGDIAVPKFEYKSPSGDQEYTLRQVGEQRLRRDSIRRHERGTFYFQPYQELHRAVSLQPETITLIVQGSVLSESTDVCPTNSPIVQKIERHVKGLPATTIRETLTQLLASVPS